MGAQVDPDRMGRAVAPAFRTRLADCLTALGDLLDEHAAAVAAGGAGPFEAEAPQVGLEIELVLVHADGPQALMPAPHGEGVLARLDDPTVVAEIARHTLEINVPPTTVAGSGLAELERTLRTRLERADADARAEGTRVLMVGILPTLAPEHLVGEWMTPSARYRALQEAVLGVRGEDIHLDITAADVAADEGPGTGERLDLHLASLAAEAACTSTQLHYKTSPEDFAATWNAAQLLAGPQLALGANSPFALGAALWAETRVPLFEQSVDTRPAELAAWGLPPRVWGGGGWARQAADVFTADVTWFPPLLPQLEEEDPVAVRAAGGVPALGELGMHSGTVWRWNRPVYGLTATASGVRAHLRVENRVLPTGPTVVDTVANAALWFGAVRALVADGPDPAVLLDADAPARAITACARDGLAAVLDWPGWRGAPVRRVLLEEVLPLAARGLAGWGVPAEVAGRYLDVAERRAATGRTGAAWQVATVRHLSGRGASRPAALRDMLARYVELSDEGAPVHTWPWPSADTPRAPALQDYR